MTRVRIEARYMSLPLRVPYWLSFGAVSAFETFLLRAETDSGVGYGEITPLPGYSFETPESVRACLANLSRNDTTISSGTLEMLRSTAPMVASGLASALDTLALSKAAVLGSNTGTRLPCVALCGGETPDDIAAKTGALLAAGYDVLKIKIGGDTKLDIERIEAASAGLSPGARLRVDANQSMSETQAIAFARAVEGLPLELFEQPFKPKDDERMRLLRAAANVPLMLDESIWTRADIDRAARLGMDYVKLKLCKHLGILENMSLIQYAQSLGLGVIYGNGVQGPLGNRQEAFIYQETGLTTAIESNGFAKLAGTHSGFGMEMSKGKIILSGETDPSDLFDSAEPECVLVAKS